MGENGWIIPCLFAREHFLSPKWKRWRGNFSGEHHEVVNTANTQWVGRDPHQFPMVLFSTLRWFVWMTNTTVDKNKHVLNAYIICSVNRWPSSVALTEISNVSKNNTHASARTFASFPTYLLTITALQKWTTGAHFIYVAIYRYWSESMALFWRCWYWGNNDNRVKKQQSTGGFLRQFPWKFAAAFLEQCFLWTAWSYRLILSAGNCDNRVNREIFVPTTNHITHFASPSPGFCFQRFMATIRSCMPDTLLQQTWTPHKPSCLSVRNVPTVLKVFLLFLLKKHFCWGGGFIEDSDCLPSAFKILSERLNVKRKFRAKPQHTHQSLSKPLASAVAKRGATSQMWPEVRWCSPLSSNIQFMPLLERLIAQHCPLTTFAIHYYKHVQASYLPRLMSDNITTPRVS